MQCLLPFPWKQAVGSRQCTSGFSHTTRIPTRTLCGSMYVPASMDVGMDCCRRSTNSEHFCHEVEGMNPNRSAVSTAMGGNKNSLVNVIVIVDLIPNCELTSWSCNSISTLSIAQRTEHSQSDIYIFSSLDCQWVQYKLLCSYEWLSLWPHLPNWMLDEQSWMNRLQRSVSAFLWTVNMGLDQCFLFHIKNLAKT